ncbi:hypothetical protein NKR23_g71 [Pleurostoma richardsiae]|uniref:Uncharacterized protein n=1 Tax=Pleurostoma richardsiae TaxID=41990 RepID=A0AA38RV04_9PEZI|nr:hypothetical protein NKR23_g71 [Pleurostoma richardsiae]
MESIQLAQMLADLSDLHAAEPEAAAALVNANKILQAPTPAPAAEKKLPEQRHHQRVASASASVARTASPAARFDKFGRKILTPPMTRANSSHGSIPGTPRRDSSPEDDIDRANTLMALYEIRAKLKQQDNTSLMKAREKINALIAKQQAQVAEKRDPKAIEQRQPRFTYPRTT